MQSTMINSILKSKWNDGRSSFDVDLNNVETYGANSQYVYNHYLFLKRELEVTADTWVEAKKRGQIRHAKLYRGKFLDYVVHKEFNTIEEWVADAGGKMEDVLYGENRVRDKVMWEYDYTTCRHTPSPYKAKYVELDILLHRLGYVKPLSVETHAVAVIPEMTTRELTNALHIEMRMRSLTIDNVYVLNGAAIVPWTTFVGQ